MFPARDASVPTLIISDCEVWIYALLGHHREIKMVSFNRLVWIKSAEQLNYLRDKRKKRNIDKNVLKYTIKNMDINCRFPRQALHRFIYALFLRFVFFIVFVYLLSAFCRVAIGHEVASAMRRRCFFFF